MVFWSENLCHFSREEATLRFRTEREEAFKTQVDSEGM